MQGDVEGESGVRERKRKKLSFSFCHFIVQWRSLSVCLREKSAFVLMCLHLCVCVCVRVSVKSERCWSRLRRPRIHTRSSYFAGPPRTQTSSVCVSVCVYACVCVCVCVGRRQMSMRVIRCVYLVVRGYTASAMCDFIQSRGAEASVCVCECECVGVLSISVWVCVAI